MKYVIGVVLALAAIGALLEWGYRQGWDAHSAKVNADYRAKKEKAQRQQANNVEKGAKADEKGSVEYQTISKEVIKYVSRPGAVKCDFDVDRMRIKQRAVANANVIEGYDNPAVSVPAAVK